ncbi:MAG: UDP-N-acetylglucosamine 1-carboxyvinyltransferase [Myxococcota bacterium]|jgi:UDP-N-acetylglucosamine 1-carboxyvinyltransferase
MSESFVIEGARKLKGRIRPSGNKNEALPVLCATLLSAEPVTLHNVPRIADVNVLLDIIIGLGGTVEELDSPNSLRICNKALGPPEPSAELCERIRASILLAGPLTGRCGSILLPPPGGDVIGRRRVDTHFDGLQALGASFRQGDAYELSAPRGLQGTDFMLDEASVTATENLVMAAVLARGTTVLRNAACEPHVQRLCHLLVGMGARIEGIASNTLTIEGVERLGGFEHTIGPDYLEVGSLIGLAACTDSDITIEGAGRADLRMILHTFNRLGIHALPVGEDDLRVPSGQPRVIKKDLNGAIPRIGDGIWPAFPTDLMSIAIVTATQCTGTVLFFEKMFEGRMFFTDRVIGMGASIILCDPHRVVVVGPTPLYHSQVDSPDVRAGMALVIAALCAKGTTTIGNIRQIDRGYERIDEKLGALGAQIERVSGG